MKQGKNNTGKLILFILLSFSVVFIAQDKKKDSPYDKINNLKGEISKIIIQTDTDELELTGEDASKIYKLIKAPAKYKTFNVILNDGDDGEENVVFFSDNDSDDSHIFSKVMTEKMIYVTNDDESGMTVIDLDADGKEITIEEKDGQKKVTVKYEDDGETKTEVFEGEEAEEYLKELGEDGIILTTPAKGGLFEWTITDDMEDGVEKEISIDKDGEEMVITVKTTKDGEETTEVFKGDEAKEWLEKHKSEYDHDMLWFGDKEDADVYILKTEAKDVNGKKKINVKIDSDVKAIKEIIKKKKTKK